MVPSPGWLHPKENAATAPVPLKRRPLHGEVGVVTDRCQAVPAGGRPGNVVAITASAATWRPGRDLTFTFPHDKHILTSCPSSLDRHTLVCHTGRLQTLLAAAVVHQAATTQQRYLSKQRYLLGKLVTFDIFWENIGINFHNSLSSS